MNRLHHWYCQSSGWKHHLENEILPWSLEGVKLDGEVLELRAGAGPHHRLVAPPVQSRYVPGIGPDAGAFSPTARGK